MGALTMLVMMLASVGLLFGVPGVHKEKWRLKRASRSILRAVADSLKASYPRLHTDSAAGTVLLTIGGHTTYIYHAVSWPDGGQVAKASARLVLVFRDAVPDDIVAATLQVLLESEDGARYARLAERTTIKAGELTIAFDDLADAETLLAAAALAEDVFDAIARQGDGHRAISDIYRAALWRPR